MKDFYVYGYVRSRDGRNGPRGSFYYIGKGRERRMFMPHKYVTVPKDRSQIVTIALDLTEADALQLEMLVICRYGRVDLGTGCLYNLTDGGEGGGTKRKHSRETIEKRRQSLLGQKRSDECRARFREFAQDRAKNPDYIAKLSAAQTGKVPSPESVEKMRRTKLGKKASPETKQKMAESRKAYIARNIELYGSPYSPKTVEKMRANAAKQPRSENGKLFAPALELAAAA